MISAISWNGPMKFENKQLDILFSHPPYSLADGAKKTILLDSVLTEMRFHYGNNSYFKRYCDRRNIDLDGIKEFSELPYIPAVAFKQESDFLSSVDDSEVLTKLRSSATSGTPSTVAIDRLTSRRQVKALSLVLGNRLGKERRPFLIIDLDPGAPNSAVLGARAAAIKGFLNLASSAGYFLRAEKDGLFFDEQRFVDAVKAIGPARPVVIFGFTSIIYAEIMEKFADRGNAFGLPEGSILAHIGGWKKLEERKVDKTVFNSLAARIFGILSKDVVDFYGFTEQMGVIYPDCECGWKHTPNYSEIVVRDEQDHSPLYAGEKGLIELITPIPHSYIGNAVLTDDIGVVAPESEDPCKSKRKGTRFRVLGRASKSEPRGCGNVMDERVAMPTAGGADDKEVRLLYGHGCEEGEIGLDGLREKIADVKTAWQWLKQQKVDLLIGLIDKVSKKWNESDFELNDFQQQGLSFLTNWCRADNLKTLCDRALYKRACLDQFLPVDDASRKLLHAAPRGVAVHWLSGNVPALGMLVLVQAMIAKNVNVLKVSHSYSEAVPALLRSFSGEEYMSPGGEVIRGDDLLRTVLVVYFSRDNKGASEILSAEADIRVAWGGRDAVCSVANLPKKYQAVDIIFGPRLSFMVVGREMLKNDRRFKKLVRKAALDSSVFDQTACASPHTIFVEKGGEVSPAEFAEMLAGQMEKTSVRIPPAPVDALTRAAIESKRVMYDFIGDVWRSSDVSWTVLYDEMVSLAPPTFGRVITVRGVDDVFDTAPLVDGNIQTIGLALTGRRRLDYASMAADKGAERFPDVGSMTHFEDPWDGLFVLQRCVRWVSLGGPN